MSLIDLDNGVRIKTFATPGEGFDPLTASAKDLALYGFPPRPDDPKLRAQFERHYTRMKGRLTCIEPAFKVRPSLRPKAAAQPQGVAGASVPFWSGAVVYAPSGDSFKWVEAEWIVPNASTFIGSNSAAPVAADSFCMVAWVGLGNSSLLQAGTGVDVASNGSTTFFLWHEWTPPGWVAITNLPVHSGDLIAVVICTPSGAGSTTSTIYFSNNTRGLQTSYELSFPVGKGDPTNFPADQAEWIVERPAISGGLAILPNYGQLYFTNANAGLVNGAVVDANASGSKGSLTNGPIDMIVDGITLSTGAIVAPTIVQCEYYGLPDGLVTGS